MSSPRTRRLYSSTHLSPELKKSFENIGHTYGLFFEEDQAVDPLFGMTRREAKILGKQMPKPVPKATQKVKRPVQIDDPFGDTLSDGRKVLAETKDLLSKLDDIEKKRLNAEMQSPEPPPRFSYIDQDFKLPERRERRPIVQDSSEIEDLEDQIADLKSEIRTLKRKLKKAEEKIQQQKDEISALQKEIQSMNSIGELSKQDEQKFSPLQRELERKIENAEQQLREERKEREQDKERYEKTLGAYREKLTELVKELEDADNINDELEAEIEKMKKQNNERDAEEAERKKREKEMEAKRLEQERRRREEEAEAERRRRKMSEGEQEGMWKRIAKEKSEEIDRLNDELSKMKEENKQLTEANAKLTEERNEVSDKLNRILSEKDDVSSGIQSQKTQMQKLKRRVKETEEENELLIQRLRNLRAFGGSIEDLVITEEQNILLLQIRSAKLDKSLLSSLPPSSAGAGVPVSEMDIPPNTFTSSLHQSSSSSPSSPSFSFFVAVDFYLFDVTYTTIEMASFDGNVNWSYLTKYIMNVSLYFLHHLMCHPLHLELYRIDSGKANKVAVGDVLISSCTKSSTVQTFRVNLKSPDSSEKDLGEMTIYLEPYLPFSKCCPPSLLSPQSSIDSPAKKSSSTPPFTSFNRLLKYSTEKECNLCSKKSDN